MPSRALSLPRSFLAQIVLTVAEHHSNLVPWQLLAQRTGAVLKFAELRSRGGEEGGEGGEEVNVEQLLELITPRTKLVATHHVSNVLGQRQEEPSTSRSSST